MSIVNACICFAKSAIASVFSPWQGLWLAGLEGHGSLVFGAAVGLSKPSINPQSLLYLAFPHLLSSKSFSCATI